METAHGQLDSWAVSPRILGLAVHSVVVRLQGLLYEIGESAYPSCGQMVRAFGAHCQELNKVFEE